MSDLVHRRLRAPEADGAALIEPAGQVQQLLEANRAAASQRQYGQYGCQGLSLNQLADAARAELLAGAIDYVSAYRDASFAKGVTSKTGFVLAGHQPELFHPGVWFKHFLLSSVARRVGALAVNLVVDSDLVRTASLRVPVRHGGERAMENVAFDAPGEPVPFEERPILDRWLFESFEQRVVAAYETAFKKEQQRERLLIERLWPAAVADAADSSFSAPLGLALARARHRLEAKLGLTTLELPLSRVAQSSMFRWFAVHLLAQLPRLHEIYNAALAEYRVVNRIRSSTHPVPALEQDDEWLEAPLFVWTKDDPRRRHVFVRRTPGGLVLSDCNGLQLQLDASADVSADKAVDQLAAAEKRGIKLRPRALVTTMYARLVLSDLFVHGIGGAKYDELTDAIVRRFWGIEPPQYVTATATFRLPIERPDVTAEDVRIAARRIRDARYHPETLLRDERVKNNAALRQPLEALAAEKRDYLARHDLRRCGPHVFARLDQLNRAMHALLAPLERELRSEHAALIDQLKQSQLVASREFSFVLFPEKVSGRLLDLARQSS